MGAALAKGSGSCWVGRQGGLGRGRRWTPIHPSKPRPRSASSSDGLTRAGSVLAGAGTGHNCVAPPAVALVGLTVQTGLLRLATCAAGMAALRGSEKAGKGWGGAPEQGGAATARLGPRAPMTLVLGGGQGVPLGCTHGLRTCLSLWLDPPLPTCQDSGTSGYSVVAEGELRARKSTLDERLGLQAWGGGRPGRWPEIHGG